MTLLTAHKILISSAVVMFVVYAAREFINYTNGDASALISCILGTVAAVGLGFYLRWVWRHRPSDR